MRAIFDLDDTISVHRNRDYPNAIPIKEVIEKIRKLKQDGWEIYIYTSRGQVSCKGDLALIEQNNREVIETWLRKHDVPCDGLIFGKPIGDIYVDDKGMSVKDFLAGRFEYLKAGGSGKNVYRFGNVVKKDFGGAAETAGYKVWMEQKGDLCKAPEVYSYLYDSVYMEYIDGRNLCDVLTEARLKKVLEVVDGFSKARTQEDYSVLPQIEILEKNISDDEEMNRVIRRCAQKLKDSEKELALHRSFCHGDMTLSNIIDTGKELYFIDPRYIKGSSTYLYDLAKLRMSLSGYEKLFGITQKSNYSHRKEFDRWTEERGLKRLVYLLNVMYVCRLYRYKDDSGKQKVKQMIRSLLQEDEVGIEWM